MDITWLMGVPIGMTGTPLVKVRESALFVRPPVPVLQRVNDDDQIVVSVGPSVQSHIIW